jgi:hypothetical protein
MINVLAGRPEGTPVDDPPIATVEGWILGPQP